MRVHRLAEGRPESLCDVRVAGKSSNQKEYGGIEAARSPLKSRVAGNLHHHNPEIDTSTRVFDRGRGEDQQPWEAMVTGKEMEGRIGGQASARGGVRKELDHDKGEPSSAAVPRQEGPGNRTVRLLTAPPIGGGDHGGLDERPARPKPIDVHLSRPSLSRRAILDASMEPVPDGNWDDTVEES
jgi:hypothetical protein